MKWIASVYILFLAAVVILADRGVLPGAVAALYAFPMGDKIGHLLLMGTFSLLANLALKFRGRPLLTGCLLVSAVVTLEEISQLFFQQRRTFSLEDLFFDMLGIWGFAYLALWIKQWAQRTRS